MLKIRRVSIEDLRRRILCAFLLRIFTVRKTTVVCFQIAIYFFA